MEQRNGGKRGLHEALLVLALASPAAGCDALWRSTLTPDPRNCVRNPGICSSQQTCSPVTEVCEPTSSMNLDMALGMNPDMSTGNTKPLCTGTATAVVRPFVCMKQGFTTSGSPITFSTPVSNTISPSPTAVAVADFDQNGLAEVAVCGGGSRFDVYQISTGGVLGAIHSTATPTCSWVATGNFDNDLAGIPDVVAGSDVGGSVSIFLGNGDLTFKANATNPFSTGNPAHFILPAYLDCDSNLDLVVTTDLTNNVVTFKNQGGGTMSGPVPVVIPMPSSSNQPDVADFDGDGVPDLLVDQKDGIDIGYGTRITAYTASQLVPVPGTETGVVGGDFDGDGNLDFAAAVGTQVAIFLRRGPGTYVMMAQLELGEPAGQLVAANLNGDKSSDLVVALKNSKSMAVLRYQPTTNQLTADLLSGSSVAEAVAVGDISCDGRPDVVSVGGGKVFVYVNTTP